MRSLLDKTLSADELKKILAKEKLISQNYMGYNALHATTEMPLDRQKKLKILLKEEANVNEQDRRRGTYHNTPLHILIANEAAEDAMYFLSLAAEKIDYSICDKQGKTTLIIAAKINSTQVSLKLIDIIGNQPEILNKQDEDGMSALHYACLYGNKEVADALITAGAATHLVNKDCKTPIDCVTLGKNKISKTLKSIEIDPERDERARHSTFRDSLGQPLLLPGDRELIPIHIQANLKNKGALLHALEDNLIDTYLLAREERVARMRDEEKNYIRNQLTHFSGISLLDSLSKAAVELKPYLLAKGHYSDWLLRSESAAGNESSVNSLLANNKERINEYGLPSMRTALHQAALNGHKEICLLLLENEAEINCQDKDGNTPLHFAIQNKKFELARQFVCHGANIYQKNNQGKDTLARLKTHNFKQELIKLASTFKKESAETVLNESMQALSI